MFSNWRDVNIFEYKTSNSLKGKTYNDESCTMDTMGNVYTQFLRLRAWKYTQKIQKRKQPIVFGRIGFFFVLQKSCETFFCSQMMVFETKNQFELLWISLYQRWILVSLLRHLFFFHHNSYHSIIDFQRWEHAETLHMYQLYAKFRRKAYCSLFWN